MHFASNKASAGKGGGAMVIDRGSGAVNVVDSEFSENQASFGGAISHGGSRLNVFGSKFVLNQAMKTVRDVLRLLATHPCESNSNPLSHKCRARLFLPTQNLT